MLAMALLLLGVGRAGSLQVLARKSGSGIVLTVALAILLLPGALKAQATVKLNAVASPSSGTAGPSTGGVTGTGFPSGTIAPANVLVSLSASCGGTATTAVATVVQNIIGSSDKVEFVIPSSLAAGSYFVSVTGTSVSGVSFTSASSCSTLTVLPGASPTLSIDTTNPTDWVIKNGALTIDYNSEEGNIWSIVPTGTQDQLIDFEIPDSGDGEATNTGLFNSGNPLSEFQQPAGWSSANPVGGSESTLGVSA